MASTNINEENTTLVFKMPLRVGAIDPSDTDWLQSPVGGNNVINTSMVMACIEVDVVATTATATVVNLAHADIPAAVKDHVNPTAIIAVLGIEKIDGNHTLPTLVRGEGSEILFTSAAGAANDTHRITFIYR
jgi:hypothetical protein